MPVPRGLGAGHVTSAIIGRCGDPTSVLRRQKDGHQEPRWFCACACTPRCQNCEEESVPTQLGSTTMATNCSSIRRFEEAILPDNAEPLQRNISCETT